MLNSLRCSVNSLLRYAWAGAILLYVHLNNGNDRDTMAAETGDRTTPLSVSSDGSRYFFWPQGSGGDRRPSSAGSIGFPPPFFSRTDREEFEGGWLLFPPSFSPLCDSRPPLSVMFSVWSLL